MTREVGTDYPKDVDTLIKDYGDEAIRCCISSWNQLCPHHPLTNVTEILHRNRYRFYGHDVSLLKEEGTRGEISEIAFDVNKHLTAKALRKHPDSPIVVLNCRTWWNYGTGEARGWTGHIEVDVAEGCVKKFPEVIPVTQHSDLWPIP